MYNAGTQKLTLIGATFFSNKAAGGGGMAAGNSHMVNTLFWGNTATGESQGSQILVLNSSPVNYHVYYSLVQDGITGTPSSTRGIEGDIGGGFGSADSGTINIYTRNENNYNSAAGIYTNDPLLDSLTISGGVLVHPFFDVYSPAVGKGAFVKKSSGQNGDTYYYSEDNSTWFTFNNAAGKADATPPATAVHLTATDARGYGRYRRPDIGAYEAGVNQ